MTDPSYYQPVEDYRPELDQSYLGDIQQDGCLVLLAVVLFDLLLVILGVCLYIAAKGGAF